MDIKKLGRFETLGKRILGPEVCNRCPRAGCGTCTSRSTTSAVVLGRIAAMASKAQIGFGSLKMDGGTPVVVESVVLTYTPDIGATIQQIGHLAFGCKVVGSAVPMDEDAQPLKKLVY